MSEKFYKHPRKEHYKRLRAVQFLKERAVSGLTQKEIGEKYNVSERTVRRALTWAEKVNLYVEIEDQLIRELAPMASERLKNILEASEDDEIAAKVALEVLKGLNIIKKNHPVTMKEVKDQDDLVVYINKKREQAQIDANTIDGQLTDGGNGEFLPLPTQLQLIGRVESGGISAADDPAAAEGGVAGNPAVEGANRGPEPTQSEGGSTDSRENRLPDPPGTPDGTAAPQDFERD